VQAHRSSERDRDPYPPHGGWSTVNVPWSHAHWGNQPPQRYGAAAESLRI
jgi:hypothetical protein